MSNETSIHKFNVVYLHPNPMKDDIYHLYNIRYPKKFKETCTHAERRCQYTWMNM